MGAGSSERMNAPMVQNAPIASITPNPRNPRTSVGDLDELAASIQTVGILQPLVVTPRGDTLMLVAGHRRLEAAKIAGLSEVPVIINLNLVSERDATIAAIVENCHRVDLTPIEEAVAYEQLGLLGLDDLAIAKATGRKRDTVHGRRRLMELPEEVRTKVAVHELTLTDAETLLEFADAPETVADLSEWAGTPSFRWRVEQERIHRQRDKKAAEEAAKRALEPAADDDEGDEDNEEEPARPVYARCQNCWRSELALTDGLCSHCVTAAHREVIRATANATRIAWLKEQWEQRNRWELFGDIARATLARIFDDGDDWAAQQIMPALAFLGIESDADTFPDPREFTDAQALAALIFGHSDLVDDGYGHGAWLGPLAEFAGYQMSDEERGLFNEHDEARP